MLVPLVWCRSDEGGAAGAGAGAGGDGGGEDEDPWAGHGLRVPDERNNHYFVRGMDEFVFEHLHEAE